MPAEKLTRTSYRDDDGDPRDGTTSMAESRRDMEEHLLPLLRVHASALHGSGVATGLAVTATTGGTTIAVGPGVAVDGLGRHLSVASGGQVLLGTGSDPVDVGAAGVVLDLTTLSPAPTPAHHLTLTFSETFDALAHATSGFQIFELDHTPRLTLQPAAAPTEPAVVLARVFLAADGTVSALFAGPRQVCPTPTGGLTVHQPRVPPPDPADPAVRTVVHQPAGSLTPHPKGGLLLSSTSIQVDGPLSVLGVLTANQAEVRDLSVRNLTVRGDAEPGLVKAEQMQVVDLTVRDSLTARGDTRIGGDLNVDGRVRSSAGFCSGSSRRQKTDVRPLDGALATVARLQGVSFRWKDDGRRDIGLIAEDVGAVLPEVVTDDDGTQARGLDYGRLTSLLIEAVKEQQREIEMLRGVVDELATRLDGAGAEPAER